MVGGGAQPWVPVRLPHDAMIAEPRDPAGEPANGYFPGGIWEYLYPPRPSTFPPP